MNTPINALKKISSARDYHAEHGEYPPRTVQPDQCFDDWAADIAEQAIRHNPSIPTAQEAEHVERTDGLVLSGPAYLDEAGSAQTDSESGQRWVLCWVAMPPTTPSVINLTP